MRTINWTIDNYFRHPFRWRKCPIDKQDKTFILGLKLTWGENMIFPKMGIVPFITKMAFAKRWVVVIYYGYRYKAWSNYSLQ